MTHFQSFYQGGTCFQPAVPSFHPPESKTIENQNGVCEALAFDVMKKVNKISTITKLFLMREFPLKSVNIARKVFLFLWTKSVKYEISL